MKGFEKYFNCWIVGDKEYAPLTIKDANRNINIKFKSKAIHRKNFQGISLDMVVIDGDVPKEIIEECKMRLALLNGNMVII